MKSIKWNEGWTFREEGKVDAFQKVTLPHDAMIHKQRGPDSQGGAANAFFYGGKYIYEKHFFVSGKEAEQHREVAFDGVYKNATVYINGQRALEHPYGYTPFQLVLDPYLMADRENCIRLEVDNSKQPNSRWYSGGGIYREVCLLTGGKTYIPWKGVKISTQTIQPSEHRAELLITITAGGTTAKNLRARLKVWNPQGIEVLDVVGKVGSPFTVEIERARYWSACEPDLYTYQVILLSGDTPCDMEEGTFGIRLLEYDSSGLYVNGKRTVLKGACIHHDNGVLGSISLYTAERRKIEILKEYGFNAIRMSHHPASDALLRACDVCGMYVLDELSDMWFRKKNPYDYAIDFMAWHEEDIKAMVAHDYNHPSVVMYSIGNEVSEPASAEGMQLARNLIDNFHTLDPDRPVTGGMNLVIMMFSKGGKGIYEEGGMASTEVTEGTVESPKEKYTEMSGSLFFNRMVTKMSKIFNGLSNTTRAGKVAEPILNALDIAGYNYGTGRYCKDHRKYPDRLILGTETYPYDVYKTWQIIAACPSVIGDFMWTGWDYIGEAAIGTWNYEGISVVNACYPWLLAGCGAIDINGYAGAEAYYADAVWKDAENKAFRPYMGIRPMNHAGEKIIKSTWRGTDAIDSWSWHGCEGNPTYVEIYAQGSYVKLYINDQYVGKKRLKQLKCIFQCKYQPGVIRADIFDQNGKQIDTVQLESAILPDAQTKVKLMPDARNHLTEENIFYFEINLVGENGIVESNMDQKIYISVEGGDLLGFGSANPKTEESFDRGEYTSYYGRALAVVRKKETRCMIKAHTGTSYDEVEI